MTALLACRTFYLVPPVVHLGSKIGPVRARTPGLIIVATSAVECDSSGHAAGFWLSGCVCPCGATRRRADVAPESNAEGARRAVADAFGDGGKPELFAAEQVLGDGHAPGEQMFHTRHARGECQAIGTRGE